MKLRPNNLRVQTGPLLTPLLGPLTFVIALTVVAALVPLLVLIIGLTFTIPFVAVLSALAELVFDELLPGLLAMRILEGIDLPLMCCLSLPESVHLVRLSLSVKVHAGLLFE